MNVTLGTGGTPAVHVSIPGAELPAGVTWELEATYTTPLGEQTSYRPRGGRGVGAGEHVLVVDWAAPPRTETTYRLLVDGAPGTGVTAIRPSDADDLIVSLDGAHQVAYRRTGGVPRIPDVRAYPSFSPGSPWPSYRYAPTIGYGGGTVTAETVGVDTARMWQLIAVPSPVHILHHCQMLWCDIPPIVLANIDGAPSDRLTAGNPIRVWELAYTIAADPEPDVRLAASTWGEVADGNLTWGAVHTANLTWADVAGADWDALG